MAKKILIVDDEEMIRELLADIIDSMDLQQVSADNGQDAIRLVQSDPDIGLVIIDMNMPLMDGKQCYQQIRTTHSSLRIILSSGRDQSDTERQFGPDPHLFFIQKPYSLQAITDIINRLLPAD